VIAERADLSRRTPRRGIPTILGFLPELDNRILRVIVSKDEPIRIITAFLDHSMKGKL